MKKLQIFIGIFICICMACEQEINKPESTIYKIDDHTWQSKNSLQFLGEYSFVASEVPLQYYLIKNSNANKATRDSIFNTHKKERIIEMKFSHITGQDLLQPEFNTRNTYTEAVEYMAFAIQKDFTAVTSSNDTILCSGAHFERNFNVAPYKKLLLYFDGIPSGGNIQLVYQDHLFGKGTVKFHLKEEPIKL